MKTKLVLLNLLLVIGVSAVVWQAKIRYDNAQQRRQAGLAVKVAPVTTPPPSPAPKPETPASTQYGDVAQKDLFSKDRNPNVIIDAPPPPEKPKPMPPLPVLYGVMGLPSGLRAIMAEKRGESSRPVRTGDQIGDFKILSLDAQNIVFEWDGKPVSRKVDDLMDRSVQAPPDIGPPGAPVGANGALLPTTPPTLNPQQLQNPTSQPQSASSVAARPGTVELGTPGQSELACVPGDTSPAGTVADGRRKVISYSPFGARCSWTPAK